MRFLTFFLFIPCASLAHAKFLPVSLNGAFDDAEVVAKIQIIDMSPHYWESPKGKATCGYTVTANVISVFKGKINQQVKMASTAPFDKKNMLAFVNNYQGPFPSDVYWGPAFEAKKKACAQRLPALKINPQASSNYTYDGNYFLPASKLKIPESIDVNVLKVDNFSLNGSEIKVEDVPFMLKVELRTTVKYINAKQLEQWLVDKAS